MTNNQHDSRAGQPSGSERSLAPGSGAQDAADLATMERAMLALPRLTQEIFLAHRLDGLGYAKIGRIVGLTPRQVERHVTRTMVHLSRFMDGDERTLWQRRWQRFRAWLQQ
ncbi:sigma factor-like helix-turn-helix DNA-binding protein [Sphingomonas sp. GB1N7]|uniref:sigma factor-like helix-turn-helix DNA-binding protein n=1 Tax=Parasphingomonas caseinilytica TaxID=3096158 RepID=UPI002FC6966E